MEKNLQMISLQSSQGHLKHLTGLRPFFGRIVFQWAVLRRFTLHLAADCSFRQIVEGKAVIWRSPRSNVES
jgi:hypothetical protein